MSAAASHPHHEVPTASGRRILLAWYLDFLLYSVFATLVSSFAGWTAGASWSVQLTGFGLTRSALGHFLQTPGMLALGIRTDGTWNRGSFSNENWCTISVGVLLVLVGAKRCVRGIAYSRALPEFGVIPDETGQMVLSLLWGVSHMTAGFLILQVRRSGYVLALAGALAGVVSVWLSLPLWSEVVALEVEGRRAAQGIAVHPGEIKFMQTFVPLALLAGNAVIIAALFMTRRRFVP